jgi:hypothetical protein
VLGYEERNDHHKRAHQRLIHRCVSVSAFWPVRRNASATHKGAGDDVDREDCFDAPSSPSGIETALAGARWRRHCSPLLRLRVPRPEEATRRLPSPPPRTLGNDHPACRSSLRLEAIVQLSRARPVVV